MNYGHPLDSRRVRAVTGRPRTFLKLIVPDHDPLLFVKLPDALPGVLLERVTRQRNAVGALSERVPKAEQGPVIPQLYARGHQPCLPVGTLGEGIPRVPRSIRTEMDVTSIRVLGLCPWQQALLEDRWKVNTLRPVRHAREATDVFHRQSARYAYFIDERQ